MENSNIKVELKVCIYPVDELYIKTKQRKQLYNAFVIVLYCVFGVLLESLQYFVFGDYTNLSIRLVKVALAYTFLLQFDRDVRKHFYSPFVYGVLKYLKK